MPIGNFIGKNNLDNLEFFDYNEDIYYTPKQPEIIVTQSQTIKKRRVIIID